MVQTVDAAIEQIETLYRSVTGQQAPPPTETPYAAIPPEKDPEAHVGEQIDRLLNSLSKVDDRPITGPGWAPPISMWHGAGELTINVDLPGVTRDALRVRLAGGALHVSGTRTPPLQEPHAGRYAEQPFGSFQRAIPIPGGLVPEELQAQLRDGVLSIRLPRRGGRAVEEKDIVVS